MRKFIAILGITTALVAPGVVYASPFTDALKSAYELNPRIKSQRKVLEQTNEQVSQAIGAFRPTASATYQNGRQRVSFDGSDKESSDVENRTLSVTQPIFMGGTNIYTYQASKDRVMAGRNNLFSLEQEVIIDAIVAYMDVVQFYRVVELSRSNVNVLDRQLQASRDRFSVGDVTRTDVSQSEARAERARADFIQSEGDLESALATFERVIGYRPENLPLPLPKEVPEIPITLEAAIDEAMEENPRVLASTYVKAAAEDDEMVATGSLLPQVSLQGTVSRQDGAGALGTSTFDEDQVVVNVTIPIYQNGSEYSRVRASELVSKQRSYDLVNIRDEIREAMILAWENLQTAQATIEAQKRQVESARVALDGVKQEHQYGSRTVLDVLDAEQEQFVAQVGLVQAERNRYVALYNVLLILGDLTTQNLGLDTEPYDPEKHYDDVKWQMIGF